MNARGGAARTQFVRALRASASCAAWAFSSLRVSPREREAQQNMVSVVAE